MFLDVCDSCHQQVNVAPVIFNQNIGYFFERQEKQVNGDFCISCILKYFFEYTGITLILGWWGVISMIITPFYIFLNTVSLLVALFLLLKGKILNRYAIKRRSFNLNDKLKSPLETNKENSDQTDKYAKGLVTLELKDFIKRERKKRLEKNKKTEVETKDIKPVCKNCSVPIKTEFEFCPTCGINVKVIKCNKCGESLEKDFLFCTKCGNHFNS